MWLKNIDVYNFRNLENGLTELGPNLNWFVGENGQGKTNFLEAVYFGLTTKSFRTHKFSDLSGEESSFKVSGLLKNKIDIPFLVQVKDSSCERFLFQKLQKAVPYYKQSAVLCFTGQSKFLVEGAPQERRDFLDRMLSYIDERHMEDLIQYKKVTSQLKGVLREQKPDFYLFKSFKSGAKALAERIVERRKAFVTELSEDVKNVFSHFFYEFGPFRIRYQCKAVQRDRDYQNRFMEYGSQEVLNRRLMVGPHLDDIILEVGKRKARHYASSGQVRALVLSIKLAFREFYKKKRGNYPIFIVDDIDAELDPTRLIRLIDFLQDRGQTIMSSVDCGTIMARRHARIFNVNAGVICLRREANGG